MDKPIDCGVASHPGHRTVNQDWLESHVPMDWRQLRARGALFAIADGMGLGGGWASRFALKTLLCEYYRPLALTPEQALVRAVLLANRGIFGQTANNPAYRGTGTTLTAAAVRGPDLYVAHVGDSRAYLHRGQRSEQITHDHAWTAEEVARRVLTPDQARRHPWRHMLTRALGPKPTVGVDLIHRRLRPGTTLVLCTDGITEHVSGPEMVQLDGARPPQHVAASLVNLSLRRGGDDNATAMVVRIGRFAATQRPAAAPSPLSSIWRRLVGLVGALASAGLLALVAIDLLTVSR